MSCDSYRRCCIRIMSMWVPSFITCIVLQYPVYIPSSPGTPSEIPYSNLTLCVFFGLVITHILGSWGGFFEPGNHASPLCPLFLCNLRFGRDYGRGGVWDRIREKEGRGSGR
ncbi:hypothetical protein ACQKWADRAFT_277817 [Trichoderma austrokoningii]